jgi:hypothetical protein
MIEFLQVHGWHIATALTALVVFYDKYIAPKTKTSKDDEILETLLRILPEELSKKLLGEKEGDK